MAPERGAYSSERVFGSGTDSSRGFTHSSLLNLLEGVHRMTALAAVFSGYSVAAGLLIVITWC